MVLGRGVHRLSWTEFGITCYSTRSNYNGLGSLSNRKFIFKTDPNRFVHLWVGLGYARGLYFK